MSTPQVDLMALADAFGVTHKSGDPLDAPVPYLLTGAGITEALRGRWHGLGHPAQVTLSWAVRVGGRAYASDLVQLRALSRDGLAVETFDGRWTATAAGRQLHEAGQS